MRRRQTDDIGRILVGRAGELDELGQGRGHLRIGAEPSAEDQRHFRRDEKIAVGTDAVTVSLEGHPDKLDDFEELLGNHQISELQRTGRVALPKLDRSARLRAVPTTQKGKVG